MTVSVVFGSFDQLFDLGLGQMLPRPIFSVRSAHRHFNCALFVSWTDQF